MKIKSDSLKNGSIIKELAVKLDRSNKGRNRILLCAVVLCMVSLTMVFGIARGKVEAEYIKSVRAAGMTASVTYEAAGKSQYETIQMLSYVQQTGKSVSAGRAELENQSDCILNWVDEQAWKEIITPAYTDIVGDYPKQKQEIMLSKKALTALGIESPEKGMQIDLKVNIGLFKTSQETFTLCGWYTGYYEKKSLENTGYISETKLSEWGYDTEKSTDVLICPADHLNREEIEKRLYEDVPPDRKGQSIIAANTYANNAVSQLIGSYELAVLGVLVILCGIFFLIQNVMQISLVEDVQQLGLLNVLGAAKRQLRKIYARQMFRILMPGILTGAALSLMILKMILPQMLGKQYLDGYGGASEFEIFRPSILLGAAGITILLVMGVAMWVIHHVVEDSSVESMHYTGIDGEKKTRKMHGNKAHGNKIHRNKTHRNKTHRSKIYSNKINKNKINRNKIHKLIKGKTKKRETKGKTVLLAHMAWQNVTRYRKRFVMTVFSLFLGLVTFLAAVVVSTGSDYVHVIEKRPDFLIAGQFSEWGQEEGYGNEYKTRDVGTDPMETEGTNFELLYANEYEEFSPISEETREKLMALPGIDKETSHIVEGTYMYTTMSAVAIRPMTDENSVYDEEEERKDGVGYYGSSYKMVQGFDVDAIQIVSEQEIERLESYVKEHDLSVDVQALKDGTGVLVLHDHKLSPVQEEQAKDSVGEPVYFTGLLKKEEKQIWNEKTPEERDSLQDEEGIAGEQSETFTFGGYLDAQADDFPAISRTWHGSEGALYFIISESGFEKLPTQKKTLCMELNLEEQSDESKSISEAQVKSQIQTILEQENQQRAQTIGTAVDDDSSEAGIFGIFKSDLLLKSENYIRGNRLILGSISLVLLFAGLANYFNVMITGVISRKKEFSVMHSIGMTNRQKKKMLLMEGGCYCVAVILLLFSAGTALLHLTGLYMEKQLSYFVYSYPYGSLLLVVLGLYGICQFVPIWIYAASMIDT